MKKFILLFVLYFTIKTSLLSQDSLFYGTNENKLNWNTTHFNWDTTSKNYGWLKDNLLIKNSTDSIYFLKPKIDTFRHLLLVSDTSKVKISFTSNPVMNSKYFNFINCDTSVFKNGEYPYIIEGYLVRKGYFEPYSYLDNNKKSLDSNIIVWLSMPRK